MRVFGLRADLARVELGELVQELEGIKLSHLLSWDHHFLPVSFSGCQIGVSSRGVFDHLLGPMSLRRRLMLILLLDLTRLITIRGGEVWF